MRVAIIHDYLNQYGGAERVLEAFCELFPDAPIYTLFYDEEKTLGRFKDKDIRTSFLDMNWIATSHLSEALREGGSQAFPIAKQSRILDKVGTRNDRKGELDSRFRGNDREIASAQTSRNDGMEAGIVEKKGGIFHKFVINNHRLFIPLMPIAASLMKVDDDYDVVLSSSAGFGKGMRVGKNTIHISYCHTPLRYAWEHYKYFNWQTYLKILSAPAFWYLRIWDKWVGRKPQKLIANSKYISEKIKKYYKREAEVIYPPVDTEKFCVKPKVKKGDYFLAVGRLIHYKKFDLIIRAFNKLNLPLLIIGNGPELENLKQLAKSPRLRPDFANVSPGKQGSLLRQGYGGQAGGQSKIEFLTSITDEQLILLYNGAQAFIFPQVEDFGLVAAEAQACGTPVIALNQGGGREIVEDGKTGILFNNQNVDDLIMAVKRFTLLNNFAFREIPARAGFNRVKIKQFDQKLIRESALRFSKNKFKKAILKAVYEARNASSRT
ncbi:MAG: glycosyltransferase [bacterium]|nr:glycosyltransferase [bacterium]